MKIWYADVLEKGDTELRQGIAEVLTGQRRHKKPDRNADVGRIVEFLRGGRHICGVVRPNPAGRKGLTILDHTGRECSLRPSKIVNFGTERIQGKQRHSLIEQLTEIHARRERARDSVDLETLWELAIESAAPEFELKDLTELYFGEEGDDDRAVLARALDDGIWFVRHGRSYAPRTRNSVVRGRERTARATQRQLELQEMAAWLRAVADGNVVSEPPGAGDAIGLLQEFVLHGADSERRGEISQLMKAAHLHGPWAAFDVLVQLGHWKLDENLDLLRSEVPIEFPAAVLAEAEASSREPLPRARPWWIGKVLAISPGDGVKDRAFSFRRTLLGYRVGIHLTLPAALVREGGLVDAEIMVRGVALNLPEQTIPLVPPQVIEAAEWSDRKKMTALSIELLLDRHFELRRSAIRLRRMRADKLLDFTSASQAIGNDTALRGLLRYAKHLHDHRLAEGEDGSSAETSTLSDIIVVSGKPALRDLTAEEPARTIYQELGLLANSMAGSFCAKNSIAAINENQGWGHTGREFSTPISDPFGSALDFVMQRQVLQWIGGKVTTVNSEADLSRVLETTAYAREVKRDVERASSRYWLLKYLEAVDSVAEGIVIERLTGGVIAGLLADQLRTFVPTRRERYVDAGDRVRVQVDRVSARRNELAVSIAEKVATV